MVDIHCHILPCVDDGSGNMSDSIEMAQLAAESGTEGIIATPHCNVSGLFENYRSSMLEKKVSTLQNELRTRNIPLNIYLGQEVFLSGNFEEHLKRGDFITLNNSRYMLAELDFEIGENSAVSRLSRLLCEGYVPVVAHPERYGFVVENPSVIKKLRSAGSLIQLNGGSLTGEFGRYVQRTAEIIVNNEFADFIASDAHSQYSRTPALDNIHELICENFSYDYADLLLKINPAKLLDNELI